ncbi:cytochrome c-type biogenesis protein CcdA [Lachnospiraceae bacterium KM106-2]|nr:cytochrome c-type biogenesis protein CcdA [Lachnospiraceae bacterium KM106-2]
MQYLITFLEGFTTFISPCLLPMLPIYISYFSNGNNDTKKTVKNAIAFVAGFTVVFIVLGAFAASLGKYLAAHQRMVQIITGMIVILFGLNFMGVFELSILNKTKKLTFQREATSIWSTFLFGIVFSIGWTPCVGTFLGSALMLASQSRSMYEGILLLAVYALGLGIPFIICAFLINQLKSSFDFIKRNYKWINRIAGCFLVIVGVMMMAGMMQYFLNSFQV